MEAARDDDVGDTNIPGVLATIQTVGQCMPALFQQHIEVGRSESNH
jgi:hypothetical protein